MHICYKIRCGKLKLKHDFYCFMKLKKLLFLPLLLLLFLACSENQSSRTVRYDVAGDTISTWKHEVENAEITTPLDSVSYAIGVSQGTAWKMGGQRSKLHLNDKMLIAGILAGLNDDSPAIRHETTQEILNSYFQWRDEQMKLENLEKGRKFLEDNAKKSGIKITESGLQYRIEKEGTGTHPSVSDSVLVNYRGMLIDGTEFESTYSNSEPVKVYLSTVIKGWTEGLQLMKEGGKYTFFIPTELAYGENVYPGPIEPNVPLIFEVELIEVIPFKSKG